MRRSSYALSTKIHEEILFQQLGEVVKSGCARPVIFLGLWYNLFHGSGGISILMETEENRLIKSCEVDWGSRVAEKRHLVDYFQGDSIVLGRDLWYIRERLQGGNWVGVHTSMHRGE